MAIRPGVRGLFWIAAGTVLLIVVAVLALRSHREEPLIDGLPENPR